jgi:uncharacterized lipoprotein YehR (DUF1307 family)
MKLSAVLFALCTVVPVLAQDASRFFKLDFVIREFDDNKLVSTKTYSAVSSGDEKNRTSIRTGNKVPYQAGPNSTNYADVGVNIDVYKMQEANGQLMVTVSADVTTIPTPNESLNAMLPHIRQNKWNATVTMPMSKPTLLFSSDDLNSKRKLQLELTATPVK